MSTKKWIKCLPGKKSGQFEGKIWRYQGGGEGEGWREREGEGGREGGREWEGGRMAALSRRIPAASRSGDFESRLLNAAEVMQRLFPVA